MTTSMSVKARKTNFSMGDEGAKMDFRTSNQMPNPQDLGFQRTVLNQKAKDDLRRVNFSFGNAPNQFETTAQAAFNKKVGNAAALLNPAKQCVTAKESHVYIGNRDDPVAKDHWRSTNSAAFDQKDLTDSYKLKVEMKSNGVDNYRPHFVFGHDQQSYVRSNAQPAPQKGVEYKPPKTIASNNTNWSLGSDKNKWQSEAQALNSKAMRCPDLVNTKREFVLEKPAQFGGPVLKKKDNKNYESSVTLGRDKADWATETRSHFMPAKQERDFAAEKEALLARKLQLQQSNLSFGAVPTDYSRSGQMYDPVRDGPATLHSMGDNAIKLRQSNFNLGSEKSDWKTETMKNYYDNDKALKDAILTAHANKGEIAARTARIRQSNFDLGGDKVEWKSSSTANFTKPPAGSYTADKEQQVAMKKALASSNFKVGVQGHVDNWSSTARDQMGKDAAAKFVPNGAAAAQMQQMAENLRSTNFNLGSDKVDYSSVAMGSFVEHDVSKGMHNNSAEGKKKKTQSNFNLGYAAVDYKTSGIN